MKQRARRIMLSLTAAVTITGSALCMDNRRKEINEATQAARIALKQWQAEREKVC